ncbi:hypothetical protein V6N13_038007 [Hibiscus sabdariffa]|uniref:Uncharacterized protein n=1 Tax=Hibiscus sabdariffa TaxID=183260 RepID=A0ABR2S4B8_9ROSI
MVSFDCSLSNCSFLVFLQSWAETHHQFGRSMFAARVLLENGLFWRIGNHEKISIRHDGWLHFDNGRIKTGYNDLNATAGVGNFLQGAQMKDGMCS